MSRCPLRSGLRVRILGLALTGFAASVSFAQLPYIGYRGVVNAGSFMSPGLAGGGVARGSAMTIFGSNLGPNSSPALSFPLQTTLGGVSIHVTQGANVVNAIPIFVSPGQVNAILPSNTPLGPASLQLSVNNARSNPVPIQVVNSSVGIFAVSNGWGPGILQNFISTNQQPINSLLESAEPNQTITLWGTGLGPVPFPDNGPPTAMNLPIQTEVFVGGISATVVYNGRSPCCASIDQIVFQVPPNAPFGCWVPVHVRTAGVIVSNSVTMAITAKGGPCSEPSNALAALLIGGKKGARIMANRIAVHHDVGTATTNDATTDVFGAYVAQESSGQFNFDPNVSLPPPGTCTTYTLVGDFTQNSGFPGLASSYPYRTGAGSRDRLHNRRRRNRKCRGRPISDFGWRRDPNHSKCFQHPAVQPREF